MTTLNIIRDTREQKGWDFENFDVEVREATLNTGDYTVAELCDHDTERDTYYPDYAVERKAGEDFVRSITSGRERFEAEVQRASDWDSPLLVIIEEPKRTFRRMQGFMQYRDVSRAAIFGTVDKWERFYNVTFSFEANREQAQRRTYEALLAQLRSHLVTAD